MEEKKYVTLEEMDELFAKEVNKRQQLYGNEPILAKKLHSPVEYMVPLLDQHLYAERLLRRAYKDVDWTKECPFPVSILTYAKLWMNPLMWKEPNIYEDFILDGRMAVEEYDTTRFIEIERIVCNIYEEVILSFADNPIAYNEDMLEVGYTKGMHEWSPLIWDVYSYIYKVLDGESIDWDEMDKKHYDFIRLRFNLNIIAENRGGKRAAELLQMLQKEWSKIKRWKTNMEKVEEKDIAEFEEHLFNGFDDLLEEWEQDKVEEAEKLSVGKPDGSFFAVSDGMTYEMCEKELMRVINGAKNKAAACREILRAETVGYFVLSDKTDQEKADAINPWVAFTNKKYVFTGDDFRKARNS